jgi:hypothetical protein
MAIVFASAGGFFYYSSLEQAAFQEAESENLIRLERINKNLTSLLSVNNKPVRILAGMQEFQELLNSYSPESLLAANLVLDHFRNTLDADVLQATAMILTVLWGRIFHSVHISSRQCRDIMPVILPWVPPRAKEVYISVIRFTNMRKNRPPALW